jgi:hypothetical protein
MDGGDGFGSVDFGCSTVARGAAAGATIHIRTKPLVASRFARRV